MQVLILDTVADHRIVATGRVVKALHAERFVEACELLAQARRLHQSLEHARRDTLAKAYRLGHAQGAAAARAELASRIADAVAARHVALTSLAPLVAELVVDAVTAILGPDERERVLSNALAMAHAMIKKARWARLRVHPGSAEPAERALARALPGHHQTVAIVSDAAVDPNDCVIETDAGVVEASLSSMLAQLERSIRQALQDDGLVRTADPAGVPA